MNTDMTKMLKWMADRYKDTVHGLPEREDGVSKAVLVGKFRVYLQRMLCFAVLRANALAINSQGRAQIRRP